MAEFTDLDQVWFVVSPHNPLKDKETLLSEYDRIHLVDLAIGKNHKLKTSNIEFSLPQPSYTIHTLSYLKEKFPKDDFVLIMGGDNLKTLHKWKNYELILRDYQIYLYNRPDYDSTEFATHSNVKHFDVPLLNISSSFIRQAISEGKSVKYMVPRETYDYITEMNLYKK